MKFPKRETELSRVREMMEVQAKVYMRARHKWQAKEAERKHFEAKLIQAASGKSHAERTINAQATDEWRRFHKNLARRQDIMDFQKLKYDLLDKEWLEHYQAQKLDDGLIRRQGGS